MSFRGTFCGLFALALVAVKTAGSAPIELAREHGQEPLAMDDSDVVRAAAGFVAGSITETLASDVAPAAAYARFFGLEPEGPNMGFFKRVKRTFGSSKPILEVKDPIVWQMSQTGPYTQYGVTVMFRDSEYRSGILIIRLERIPREGQVDLVAVRPVSVYVSLF